VVTALALIPSSRAFSGKSVQEPTLPAITNATVLGKKLLITGINFTHGAVIFVEGKKFKTKNDIDNPSTLLVAKKGGKKIKPQEIVNLQVRNSDGVRSETFPFFSGRVVTIDDSAKAVELEVGERFVVLLKKPDYEWSITIEEPAVITKLEEVPIQGSQGLFFAERPGQTRLIADGELPCHKSSPPCLSPSLTVEIQIIVR
jgi:hypothetical protein